MQGEAIDDGLILIGLRSFVGETTANMALAVNDANKRFNDWLQSDDSAAAAIDVMTDQTTTAIRMTGVEGFYFTHTITVHLYSEAAPPQAPERIGMPLSYKSA